jgi:hypothetical protein
VGQLLPNCNFDHVMLARTALQHEECEMRRFSAPDCVRAECAIEAAGDRNSESCNHVQAY